MDHSLLKYLTVIIVRQSDEMSRKGQRIFSECGASLSVRCLMEFGKEKIQLLLKKKCGILLHDMRRVPTLICSILTISVIISMFFAGCGGSGKTGEGPLPEARWTFMVFMAGDSDISQA